MHHFHTVTTIILILMMVVVLAAVYIGLGWYLDYQKWYVKYADGRISRGPRSKRTAIEHAQCWDGIYVFSIVNVFGKKKKFIYLIKNEPFAIDKTDPT